MGQDASRVTGDIFATTLWSQVLSAGRGSPAALGRLIERYRPAILRVVAGYMAVHGRHGHEPDDLAQEFCLYVVEKRESVLGGADRAKGRFRAWLRGCLRNWLHNWADRETAQKRGGGRAVASLEAGEDGRGVPEPAGADLEREFDRHWAREVMDAAFRRLKAGVAKGHVSEQDLRVWELKYAGDDPSDREIAEKLELTENIVLVSLRRSRRLFREHLRAELLATVSSEKDLEEELNDLRKGLAG
jgi:RNA polymerase sigma-70 factor (ECF subfamily)